MQFSRGLQLMFCNCCIVFIERYVQHKPTHANLPVLGAGNDHLHMLTSGERQQLRIVMADFEGDTEYAEYDNFTVASACTQYTLASLGAYKGTAGKNCFLSPYELNYSKVTNRRFQGY